MDSQNRPYLSLVLPAYNEAENIGNVLADSVRALEQCGRSWEIIVVDNCSSDATAQAVGRFAAGEPRVRLVVHDRNRLYSGSCQTGLDESRGDLVAIMDSDGQFTARDLPKFIGKIQTGANLVFGWRKERHDPLFRKLTSLVFNTMGKWYLRFPLHDLNVGLRMFDRKFMAVAHVRHTINMSNPELYVCAKRANLVLDEVPIEHAHRTKGKTSHNLFKFGSLFLNVARYMRALRDELKAPGAKPAARTTINKAA